MLVKIKKGHWVHLEDLTDSEKKKLGLEVDIDEVKILKELKETPNELKKSLVKRPKKEDE